jgi:poly(3-hydroxybutyrate) depolymerase
MLIRLASFLLIFLVTVRTEAQAPNRNKSFTSSGKKIQAEVFAPASAGKHPAVMLLYGAGGLLSMGILFDSTALD